MLECVVNVSEGRDRAVLDALAAVAGATLLDLHHDSEHNRAVLTLAGPGTEDAARAVAQVAVARIDLRRHAGVHPRLGSIDVVPFVPLDGHGSPVACDDDLGPALAARAAFADWAASELGLPCFFYGPERALPEVRRNAFAGIHPDRGPGRPHPSAGACAVGARGALVAYNLWLTTADVAVARAIAVALRGPGVRALGLATAAGCQVSCNLTDPYRVGPAAVYDAVVPLARAAGTAVRRAELVGLAPASVVDAVAPERRAQLDLEPGNTVEARLARRAK